MKRKARLFFSFRSPFSWMLVERLQRAVVNPQGLIEFIPFWEPDAATHRALREKGADFHYTQMSKAKHLYILQDTKRLAQQFGLRMVWPVDVNPWWEVPHLSWLRARQLGMGAPFYAALIAARWGRGENICDLQVIRTLAASVGIDGDVAAGATDDPEIRAEGVDCLVEAYQDDIFGVPYLRFNSHRFWGVDRLDGFLSLFLPAVERDGKMSYNPQPAREPKQHAAEASVSQGCLETETSDPLYGVPSEVQSRVGGYDTDTAGGCG
jgi:2-hydroxychromene-2-carboxylate isomerase